MVTKKLDEDLKKYYELGKIDEEFVMGAVSKTLVGTKIFLNILISGGKALKKA